MFFVGSRPNPFTYSYKQQLIRSLIYGTQFTAAFRGSLLLFNYAENRANHPPKQ